MLRRVLAILAGVSLLMFVVVGVVWVRSYSIGEQFFRDRILDEKDGSETWVIDVLCIGRGGVGFNRTAYHGFNMRESMKRYETRRGGKTPFYERSRANYPGWSSPNPRLRPGWDWVYRIGSEEEQRTMKQGRLGPGEYTIQAVFPVWAALPVTGMFPTLWCWGWWRRRGVRRRVMKGMCGGCGYDLRATVGRCSECGRVPEPRGTEERA